MSGHHLTDRVEEADRRRITRMLIEWRAFKRRFSLRAIAHQKEKDNA